MTFALQEIFVDLPLSAAKNQMTPYTSGSILDRWKLEFTL
jgi:hypothetical protein